MAPPSKVVLILDTDEATRELYRRELARRFRVLTCSTEHEAWAALAGQGVDALVLELTALDDDDWSFVARLHAMEQAHQPAIVVCSTLDARRRGAELGAAAYLIKPVAPHALMSALAAALQSTTTVAEV